MGDSPSTVLLNGLSEQTASLETSASILEALHERVIAEAQKVPDVHPEFHHVFKVPEFPDIPEDVPLQIVASLNLSRDSLLSSVSDPHSQMNDSRRSSASRKSSFSLVHDIAHMFESPEIFRHRRASEGSLRQLPVLGNRTRKASDSSSVFEALEFYKARVAYENDIGGGVVQPGVRSRKYSVVSMAPGRDTRSQMACKTVANEPKTNRVRRYSDIGVPCRSPHPRLRSYSDVSSVFEPLEFLSVHQGSRYLGSEVGEPDLPEGAVEQCSSCGSRRFSTAAFGVSGPPIELSSSDPPSCLVCSPVYCQGDLLRVVQLAGVFPDSKTFVDKKVKVSPEETLRLFHELLQRTGGDPSREQVVAFVNQTFEDGDELEKWSPEDWKETPSILDRICCDEYRAWAAELNALWKSLGRRMKDDVRDNPQLYSLLYVPNGFIIPGGRFTELYYWDTYWIVQGMLWCDMRASVKGVIENLLHLVRRLGFVPNGSRVYYDQRSQPPLLIPMINAYLRHSGDVEFVRDNIDAIEREFQFWINNATVEVNCRNRTYRLARYFAPSDGPRPESYREDVLTAAHLATEEERQHLYWDIKSAASTGWDFSSRWVIHDGTNGGTLGDLHTRYIVPVDLNAFLYGNAVILAEIMATLGFESRALEYRILADQWREAVTAVLWHPDLGTWLDYDLLNNAPRRYFYASNLTPLWTRCYDANQSHEIAHACMRYLFNTGVLKYLGGTPTSLMMTGEQWDFPNCWSPLQGMLVQGLHDTADPAAQRLALELARRWLVANYRGFLEHQQMFEKYEVEVIGRCGGGGEYAVQAGFGWTNGVVFELLQQYGKMASARDEPEILTYESLLGFKLDDRNSVDGNREE